MDDPLLKALPPHLAEAIEKAQQRICPKCGSALDKRWQCDDCDFDATPLVRPQVN